MSTRYANYEDAYDAAVTRARTANIDVAIRRTSEYGKWGYNVSYASRNDSDYVRAEIVTPNHPRVQRKEQQ